MRRRIFASNFAAITLIVVLFIVYGSLYPFAFHHAPAGAVRALLEGWSKRPGRGDALANILLYVPLGFFGASAIRREAGAGIRVGLVILLGLSLSVCMELLQYYDAGRDTEATDVYTNVAGTALGIAAASLLGDHWKKWRRHPLADPAALMLLAAWAGYNLFPFVPVIDLHKYWGALQPVIHPALTGYTLFTHVAAWVTVAVLVKEGSGSPRAGMRFAGFAALLLGAKVVVAGQVLTAAELGGAAVALCVLMALANRPRAMLIGALVLLGCSVIAQRLEPFHFAAQARQFGWIPFRSFMNGSIQVDSLSFLEKGFLYGSLIWLLHKTGLRLFTATASVAAILLATSWAEVYLPGRSAEITDAAMALFTGSVIALIRPAPVGGPAQRSKRSFVRR